MPMFYRRCKQLRKGNVVKKETEIQIGYSILIMILGILVKIFIL